MPPRRYAATSLTNRTGHSMVLLVQKLFSFGSGTVSFRVVLWRSIWSARNDVQVTHAPIQSSFTCSRRNSRLQAHSSVKSVCPSLPAFFLAASDLISWGAGGVARLSSNTSQYVEKKRVKVVWGVWHKKKKLGLTPLKAFAQTKRKGDQQWTTNHRYWDHYLGFLS